MRKSKLAPEIFVVLLLAAWMLVTLDSFWQATNEIHNASNLQLKHSEILIKSGDVADGSAALTAANLHVVSAAQALAGFGPLIMGGVLVGLTALRARHAAQQRTVGAPRGPNGDTGSARA
jgi:hypothetical protein